ncbi:MAG: elongation factor P [candidate division NC10 bacterium]|nr:elongation factor P [candidate division NC10 bacterium]MBI2163489.1 elongation factor P [candidate division NC10 bacterium]MBI2458089.1 elongation factor P [candidate division NC10 bacterium]MBI2561815.1 elongation factor P [candidate division NC10 bacterium]
MILAGDLRPGIKVEVDGVPFVVTDFQWVKPGKGGAFMRTKLRNLRTGAVIERTFRTEEKLPTADLEEKRVQFLYQSGDEFHFMDTETYEQFFLSEDQLGEARKYLTEEMVVTIVSHRETPLAVEVPTFVELVIRDTEPGVRGDTASGGSKPATLETGAMIQVPLFINVGDRVRVDTRTGAYIERA